MRRVRVDAKYTDISFCTKYDCKKKTCYRHICHCAEKYMYSAADFEGKPQYCLKAYEENKKEKK